MARAKLLGVFVVGLLALSQQGCFHHHGHCDMRLAPDSAASCSGAPVTINVLANDVIDKDQDGDEQISSVTISEPPDATLGTAVVNADNTITFTPAVGATGQATLEYQVCLQHTADSTTTGGTTTSGTTTGDASTGGTTTGSACAGHHHHHHEDCNCCRDAQVTVSIRATDQPPTATDDTATTTANTAVDIDVLSNDTDPDSGDVLTITAVSTPTSGTATIIIGVGGKQEITYTPNSDFTGTDAFTYTIADQCGTTAIGNVNVTINPAVVTPPVVPNVAVTLVTDPINAANEANTSASGTGDANLNISVVASDGTTTTAAQTTTVASDGTWSVSNLDVTSLADGTITYTATATDASSNTATASLTATKNAAPVIVATPSVAATAPAVVPPALVLLVNHSPFEISVFVKDKLVNVVQPHGSTIVPDQVAAGTNERVRVEALLPRPRRPRDTTASLDLLSKRTYTITYTDDGAAAPTITAVLDH